MAITPQIHIREYRMWQEKKDVELRAEENIYQLTRQEKDLLVRQGEKDFLDNKPLATITNPAHYKHYKRGYCNERIKSLKPLYNKHKLNINI